MLSAHGIRVSAAVVVAALVLASGFLGGRQTPPSTPTPVLAAGASHSVAVDASGVVWAWGANFASQVGDGTTITRNAPVALTALTGTFTAVAAGTAHSLALRSDGGVFGWGLNAQGEVGDGSTTRRPSPVPVSSLTGVVAIAAGGAHSLALRRDGTVAAWGANQESQLGDDTTTRRTTPVTVVGLTNVVAIAAGGVHSLALKADGTLWAWGGNAASQIGDNTTTRRRTPVPVTGMPAAKAIGAGGIHSVAVAQSGQVYAWGGNLTGAVGDGSIITRRVPVVVPGLSAIATVAAGAAHTAAVSANGSHWAWGANLGQLGDGSILPRLSPVAITPPGTATFVAAGDAHSLALTSDGTVWSTGVNLLGPLGSGNFASSVVYAPISGPGRVWGVSPPTFTPAGGTFFAPQSVTLSTLTPGATIRYTTTGVDPTTSDPSVPSGGTVVVDRTTVLKARAFRTGLTPSAVTTATYTLQVTTPAIDPGTGTFTTPQTVTLSTACSRRCRTPTARGTRSATTRSAG
jgi:alpha-tubulin suppressor-like RCC1 family protein